MRRDPSVLQSRVGIEQCYLEALRLQSALARFRVSDTEGALSNEAHAPLCWWFLGGTHWGPEF